MLADVLAGVSPAGGNCPVATVVISGGGKGDQPVGSPEVKVSVGWGSPVGSAREASNSTGRSKCEPVKPRNISPTRSGWWDRWGVLSPSVRGEGQGRRRRNWVQAAAELPGGRRGRHVERERAAKAPNHWRVAEGGTPSEGIAYKPPGGEVAMCRPVGRMGPSKCCWTGPAEPGPERGPLGSSDSGRSHGGAPPIRWLRHRAERTTVDAESTNDGGKLGDAMIRRHAGRLRLIAGLEAVSGKTRRTEF
jgi:hypothetical protein